MNPKSMLIFWLLLGIIVFPSSIFPLDYLVAIEKAKNYDPRFLAVKHEYRASLTLPKQSRASLLPQITASYFKYQLNYLTSPPHYFDYSSYNFRLQLQQSLFNLVLWQDYLQSKERVNLAEQRLTEAELELVKRVSEAYFNFIFAQERLKVLEEEKRALQAQLQMAKALFQAGEATLTDIHDVEARLAELEFRRISAEKEFHSAKNNLVRLIGEEIISVPLFREDLPLPELSPPDLEYWKKLAQTQSPLVKYYHYSREIARREISKQSYHGYPRVDLMASYIKTSTIEYLRTAPITYSTLGIQITMPLFTGGYISAKKEEARERFRQADKEYERTLSEVLQQVIETFFGVQSASAKIKASQVHLRSAEVALESTKKSYRAGLRTLVDVLNAESFLFQAKHSLLQAKFDYLKNFLALKYTCGNLTTSDLETINRYFVRGD